MRVSLDLTISAINAPTEEQRELAKIYADGYRYMQYLSVCADLIPETSEDVCRATAKAIVSEMESCLHSGYDERGRWHNGGQK